MKENVTRGIYGTDGSLQARFVFRKKSILPWATRLTKDGSALSLQVSEAMRLAHREMWPSECVYGNGQMKLDCCGLSGNKEKMLGVGTVPGRHARVQGAENLGSDLWLSYLHVTTYEWHMSFTDEGIFWTKNGFLNSMVETTKGTSWCGGVWPSMVVRTIKRSPNI